MATSPEDPASRASMLSKAQSMASTLNRLSRDVQSLRQETETRISTDVSNLNQMLSTLDQVNGRLKDISGDGASRASLLDQRDRLVSQVSELIGVRADYRDNGTVALTTLSGIGLLDGKAGRFEFTPAGQITADSIYDQDASKNTVGTLSLISPSGLKLDMAANNSLQGGELAGLIELRDKTLVETQKQLDQIAVRPRAGVLDQEHRRHGGDRRRGGGFRPRPERDPLRQRLQVHLHPGERREVGEGRPRRRSQQAARRLRRCRRHPRHRPRVRGRRRRHGEPAFGADHGPHLLRCGLDAYRRRRWCDRQHRT